MPGTGYPATLRPGIHSETQRVNFREGGRPYRFGGPGIRRCGAIRSNGGPCRQVALSGQVRCIHHCGPEATAELRKRKLDRIAAGKGSPREVARMALREAVNRQKAAWRQGQWLPGQTLDLGGEAEGELQAALAFAGHRPEGLAPALLDAMRWRWRRAFMDGRHAPDVWAQAVRGLAARVAAAGAPPPEWRPSAPPAEAPLMYRVTRPGVYSRRRRLDPPRPEAGQGGIRPSAASASQVPPNASDVALAAVVLATREAEIAPVLRGVTDGNLRFRVALTYGRLAAGQASLADWHAVVAEVRRAAGQ